MSLGLQRGYVSLEPHSIEWEISALGMIELLKNILKDVLVDAQHIGSTSIKTVPAKPIIDIVVGVFSFEKLMNSNDILLEHGIIYRGQDHADQHLYVCGDFQRDIRTHHIHAVIYGAKAWTDYLNLRDYLNTHEDDAMKYSRLKEELANQYPNDRGAYTNGKHDFIVNILKKAEEWTCSIG